MGNILEQLQCNLPLARLFTGADGCAVSGTAQLVQGSGMGWHWLVSMDGMGRDGA